MSGSGDPDTIFDLPTPAVLIDRAALDHNIATMAEHRPGPALRPHVKAFKSTALARRVQGFGHENFCCATIAEMEGMANAGLGADLLLANEVVDARRLGALTDRARITLAVDSEATIDAAAIGGVTEVLIDVNVGLPRCGCPPDQAGRLADTARRRGLHVRGVMGYEGHLMMADPVVQAERVAASMALLVDAHQQVGGDVVSAGGTGTFHCNLVATEIQAGSYLLMDSQYGGRSDLPFRQAITVLATVISVDPAGGIVVADAGLKAFSMDHGNPEVVHGEADVLFCSDEHITLAAKPEVRSWAVGDRVRLIPAHVDPTVAKHRHAWVVDGETVVDRYDIDLRHW